MLILLNTLRLLVYLLFSFFVSAYSQDPNCFTGLSFRTSQGPNRTKPETATTDWKTFCKRQKLSKKYRWWSFNTVDTWQTRSWDRLKILGDIFWVGGQKIWKFVQKSQSKCSYKIYFFPKKIFLRCFESCLKVFRHLKDFIHNCFYWKTFPQFIFCYFKFTCGHVKNLFKSFF